MRHKIRVQRVAQPWLFELPADPPPAPPPSPLPEPVPEGKTRRLGEEECRGTVRAVLEVFAEWRRQRNGQQPGPLSHAISLDVQYAIPLEVETFKPGRGKGQRKPDLWREGRDWEVKIGRSGIVENASHVPNGQSSYLCVRYDDGLMVKKIFVVYDAEDHYFRKKNEKAQARSLLSSAPRVQLYP